MASKAPVLESLDQVVAFLHGVFANPSVDVDYVERALHSYKSKCSQWQKYAKFDRFKYTRNLVDDGNGAFNVMLLCWPEGISSSIHDHSNSHCFMKVLQGELKETRYEWPNDQSQKEGMKKLGQTCLCLDEVCYINDQQGLHQVENASHSEPAVSLHVYVPPFNSCHMFDMRTGKRNQCRVTFWSSFGRRNSVKVPEPTHYLSHTQHANKISLGFFTEISIYCNKSVVK